MTHIYVWSDGNPQVYIKDIGWNVWSDGDPQVYINYIGWNVWSDGDHHLSEIMLSTRKQHILILIILIFL